jgi:F-type H+-transporting ATPase subunit epsilon
LGSTIDTATAENEYEQARQAFDGFEGKPPSPEKVKAEQALARSRARLSASRGG